MAPGSILRAEYLGAPCYVRVERLEGARVVVALPGGVEGIVLRPARCEGGQRRGRRGKGRAS